MDLKEKIDKLRPVIEKAGDLIMSFQRQDKKVSYKDHVNLITVADNESEKFIYNQLSDLFPQDAILAEEGHSKEGDSGYTWVIDPVDGTTSYAHGFPFFCISAGLVDKNNKAVLGMVHAPLLNETFSAYKGGGAHLNGEKISVSPIETLKKSLVGTGFPYNRREIMDKLMHRLSNFLYVVHDVRRTGSAALDMSYVACGRLDAYFEQGLQAWDVAAASIILEEAGGKLSKFDGSEFDIFVPETAVSNGLVHEELIEILQKK